MSLVVWVGCPGGASSFLRSITVKNGRQRGGLALGGGSAVNYPTDHDEKLHYNPQTSQEKVREMVLRQATLVRKRRTEIARQGLNSWDLDDAYNRCIEWTAIEGCSAAFSKSSHHFLKLVISWVATAVTPIINLEERDRMKALAALAVWCRRTDDLVDGINSCCATPEVIDRWEQRLIDLYEGHPHDMYDAALSHALSKYPIDLQLFKDLLQGMRMDMSTTRYENFDQLYLYMYRVAGTIVLMFTQLMGTCTDFNAPLESIYKGVVAFAISAQLTDMLRDVTEDARMGRIYLPQDELAKAGLSEDDIYSGKVSDKLRSYMKELIIRVREYADEGEKFINEMNFLSRLLFWTLSLTNREMLDAFEANDYNLTNPAPVEVSKIVTAFLMASCSSIAGECSLFS